MFMVALDNLVVSTALRTFAAEFQADTTDLQWFVNAYVLSFACLLLTGAALGDRLGRRRLFVLGIAAFTLASLACAFADTSGELIAGRAAQGVGAAAVMPLSLTLLAQAVPDQLRSLALGLWSAVSGLAVALDRWWAARSPTASAGSGSSGSTCPSRPWTAPPAFWQTAEFRLE
ncbi:MFS transporter [Streptomyces werraensis]|uniref:MFS transporter n=1 Tax=Streptomyces werraensis TaxID=68284 RepID=UPI0038263D71